MRYADSADARGLGSEGDFSEAWRYRDWVVDAFNRDLPYDQFVINQIAGDLLPPEALRRPPRRRPASRRDEARNWPLRRRRRRHLAAGPQRSGGLNIPGTIATGMLALGNWGNGDADKDKILTDIADDQVDVVSRGFMGLTVACARCHDHKFDPIATKDYYGLAGIFFSSHILPKLTPKGAGEIFLRIPLETKADADRRSAVHDADDGAGSPHQGGGDRAVRRLRAQHAAADRALPGGGLELRASPGRAGHALARGLRAGAGASGDPPAQLAGLPRPERRLPPDDHARPRCAEHARHLRLARRARLPQPHRQHDGRRPTCCSPLPCRRNRSRSIPARTTAWRSSGSARSPEPCR